MTVVVDASGVRVGRLATVVAKRSLLGDSVIVINAEKAIITGSKEDVVKKYRAQHERGRPTKGPFQPRMPDRFVRRIIRGMLPYKTDRGSRAFKRIKVFIGNPNDLKPNLLIPAVKTYKFVTVKQVCQLLGGRNE